MRTFSLLMSFCFILHPLPATTLGIGAPIVDVVIPVSFEEFEALKLEKGGSRWLTKEEFETILRQIPAERRYMRPGGSCSNTIRGLACLKSPCAFIGMVGNDEAAHYLRQSMAELGIESRLLVSTADNTSHVISLVTPDGERTMRCYPGAGTLMTGEDLQRHHFHNIKHLRMDGYDLYNPNLVQEALKQCKALGITSSIDLSSYELVDKFQEEIFRLLPQIHIVFANEDEAKALTGLGAEKACEMMRQKCDVVVILMGEKGCWIGSQLGQFLSPTSPREAVDTTGAGDLFASGFLYAYLNGANLKTSAECGHVTGGTVVTVLGAEIPQNLWDDVRKEIALKTHTVP